MKVVKIALAAVVALSTSAAFAHSHKRHHHHLMRSSAGTSNPNGTAAGPTSLSGTGSSKFGGNIPGSPRATGQ
jgi:hypothetical protein